MRRSAWQWGLTVAASTWALVLFVTPALAARPGPAAVAGSASALVYAFSSIICHQRPERSFQLWSAQLPVCARCTGLYLGAASAALLALAPPFKTAARRDTAARARRIVAAAAVPTFVTLLWEWTGGGMPANWIRALSGLPLGAAIMWVILQTAVAETSLEVN